MSTDTPASTAGLLGFLLFQLAVTVCFFLLMRKEIRIAKGLRTDFQPKDQATIKLLTAATLIPWILALTQVSFGKDFWTTAAALLLGWLRFGFPLLLLGYVVLSIHKKNEQTLSQSDAAERIARQKREIEYVEKQNRRILAVMLLGCTAIAILWAIWFRNQFLVLYAALFVVIGGCMIWWFRAAKMPKEDPDEPER